jgi:hypothetical protein
MEGSGCENMEAKESYKKKGGICKNINVLFADLFMIPRRATRMVVFNPEQLLKIFRMAGYARFAG